MRTIIFKNVIGQILQHTQSLPRQICDLEANLVYIANFRTVGITKTLSLKINTHKPLIHDERLTCHTGQDTGCLVFSPPPSFYRGDNNIKKPK